MFMTDSTAKWKAVVLLVMHGLAGVLWVPASQVMIHKIVRIDELPSAVRVFATGRYLGFVAGPAVGAALLLLLRALGGYFHQRAHLCSAVPVADQRTLRLARLRHPGQAPGSQWVCRHLGDAQGGCPQPGVNVHDGVDRRLVVLRRQRLPGPDAGICRRSRPQPRQIFPTPRCLRPTRSAASPRDWYWRAGDCCRRGCAPRSYWR